MKTKEWISRRPQHLLARVVCLLLAVITWLCVMRVAPPTRTVTLTDLPVRVVDEMDIRYTVEGAIDLDRVRIKGKKDVLATLKSGEITAYVKMADLQTEAQLSEDLLYPMTVYFKLPEGVEIDGSYSISVRIVKKS